MSVCIEQSSFNSNHNNFSQHLSAVAKIDKFPQEEISKNSQIKKSIFSQIKTWIAHSRQRKQLAQLDERMLKDIGYTPKQAREEFTKPFWK